MVVIWKNYGTAAVIHTLWRRRLVETNLILLGHVPEDSLAVKGTTGLMAKEIEQIAKAARPTVVRFSLPSDKGIVGLLSLVLFVPMMCEIHSVE